MLRGFNFSSSQRWIDSLPKRASSVNLILEHADGRALIVKANYKPYWTFPGGGIDEGETPKDAVIRETLEEVGIDVHPETIEFVSVADRMSNIAQMYLFVFKAPLGFEEIDEITLQASELDAYLLVSKEEVLTGNRYYAKAVEQWAAGVTGYVEQSLESFDTGSAAS